MHLAQIPYGGWANCYRLSNKLIDLVITGDVGPRIIRFGFLDGQNEFAEFAEDMGKTGGDEWRIYGGHRLWHAPELRTRTYAPDNSPIRVEQRGSAVHVHQPLETSTGIEKSLELQIAPEDAQVRVIHRLRNTNAWAIELSVWALSVMTTGGTGIFPHSPRGSHETDLLPSHPLVLWSYTDMRDPRWMWGEKYVLLRQDATMPRPQKFGMNISSGWAAYVRGGNLFVKTFGHEPDGRYPDFGSSVESFTNDRMLEVETLSPLTTLAPGEIAEHIENWFLFRNVPTPQNDMDVDRDVLPHIHEAQRFTLGRKVV